LIVSLAPSETGEPEVGLHFEFMHPLFQRRVLGPGEEHPRIKAEPPGNIPFTTTPSGAPTLKITEKEDIFLYIHVSYRGPFTRGHYTIATWRLDTLTNRFVESFSGDDAFNTVK
jgi:hypothetical protein